MRLDAVERERESVGRNSWRWRTAEVLRLMVALAALQV